MVELTAKGPVSSIPLPERDAYFDRLQQFLRRIQASGKDGLQGIDCRTEIGQKLLRTRTQASAHGVERALDIGPSGSGE